MRDTTRIIEPNPAFAPRPSITETMGPDDLWSYACLCGYRYKLSEHDKAPSTQPAQPVRSPTAFKVRDRIVRKNTGRRAIVTALTPRGFNYFLDDRWELGPRHGFVDDGESFDDKQWELAPPSTGP